MLCQINFICTHDYFMGPACQQAYPNHPKGCPNYSKKEGCPPNTLNIFDVYEGPWFLIFNKFNLRKHVIKMRKKHPNWTNRQLVCCLYWQGTARKKLKEEIKKFEKAYPKYTVITTPEAMGVNVTQTMRINTGIELEWPPKNWTYQVAIAGIQKI